MIKLWHRIQNDPVLLRKINGWSTVFFFVLTPVSLVTGWVNSVAFVSVLSLVALVLGSLSAWQASRVEVVAVESEDGLIEENRHWISNEVTRIVKEARDERDPTV